MQVSDNELLRWKKSFAKSGIDYDNDEDYHEAIHNLTAYIELLIELDREFKKPEKSGDDSGEMFVFDKDGNKVIL